MALGNVFRLCHKDDGVFGIAEVSYNHKGSYYSLGNALYCNETISATPWFYTEQNISQKVALLVSYSHAFSEDAECKDFIGLGTHCQLGKYQLGAFKDFVGFGAFYKFGSCQLGAFTDYANFVGRNEFATEITCKIPLSQKMHIQPTVHIISSDSKFYNVAMMRVLLSL